MRIQPEKDITWYQEANKTHHVFSLYYSQIRAKWTSGNLEWLCLVRSIEVSLTQWSQGSGIYMSMVLSYPHKSNRSMLTACYRQVVSLLSHVRNHKGSLGWSEIPGYKKASRGNRRFQEMERGPFSEPAPSDFVLSVQSRLGYWAYNNRCMDRNRWD